MCGYGYAGITWEMGVWFPVSSELVPVVGERTTCFSCGFLGVKGLNVCFGCEFWHMGRVLY